jgi:hypothetical protein
MDAAIWYVIEGGCYVICGALLSLMIIIAILSIILQGDRFDFWRAWNLRKGGDVSGIDAER